MRKLCPNCEELLKPTSNPEVGECSGCGWSGHYWRAAREPALPTDTPKMSYVSIDIETTGLDPETCQTLEIGAVFDNWTLPLDKLPRFHCYVVHKQIVGQPFALALNADILRKLANPQKTEDFLPPSEVADAMATWLGRCGWDVSKVVTPAGKNFASFDRQFLKRLPNFENKVRYTTARSTQQCSFGSVSMRNCRTARRATSGPGWTRRLPTPPWKTPWPWCNSCARASSV